MVQAVLFLQFYALTVTLLTRQIACQLKLDDVELSKYRSSEHVFRQFAIKQSTSYPEAPERAPLDASHQVIFVVRQKNMETLTRFVDDVSNPKSANYGNYKTREEIGVMTENLAASKTVKTYIIKAGAKVTEVSPYQEYITAVAPVYVWEKIFDTRFHQYNFSSVNDTGYPVTIYRADRYSIPLKLDTAVVSVLDTVQMPELQNAAGARSQSHRVPRKSQGFYSVLERDKNVITPSILINSYEVDTSIGHPRATQSIFEAINIHIGVDDVAQFQRLYNLPQTVLNSSVGGHADASTQFCKDNFYTCMEGNLDTQYMMALSPISPTISHYAVNFHSWTVWLIELASSKNIPLVMSISYCSEEATIDWDEQQAFNTMAIKLSAMGVTLVVASGDAGATTNWRFKCEYTPQFPASCPYVLTVGGTMGLEDGRPEVVCSSPQSVITSGGGFSIYNDLPAYQKKHVEDYFAYVKGKSSDPVAGYSVTGRGYPDISAAANNYNIVNGGELIAISGTSASAPVIAAMISLVNAARFKVGGKSLGWVHPAMYEGYQSFVNDITIGKNNCTNAYHTCCPQGFEATPGWDPATGLGTLNFRKFKNYMMDLKPSVVPVPSSKPSPAPSYTPTDTPTSSSLPTMAPTTSLPSSRTPTTSFPTTSTPTETPKTSRPSTEEPTAPGSPTSQPTRDPPTVRPSKIPSRIPTTATPRYPPTRAPQMPRPPFGTGPHPRRSRRPTSPPVVPQ